MREVIQLHVGQAGLQLGNSCWELFCLEHGLQPDGQLNQTTPNTSNLQVFFSESVTKNYTPRAAFFDGDDVTTNQVKNGPLKKIMHPSYVHNLKTESGSIWPRASELDEESEEIIRKLLEGSDAISGIVVYHSMSGGYGGGFTCKLLEQLKAETSKTTKVTVTIMPSQQKISVLDQSSVEPYNSTLTMGKILDLSDFNIFFENAAIYKVCEKQLGLYTPNFYNLNNMIAQAISSITQSFRFKGSKFVDFYEMRANLIPTPKQQLLWCSYAPFVKPELQNTQKLDLQNITGDLFVDSGAFINFDPLTHKFIGSSLFFRGDCPLPELKSAMKAIKESDRIRFIEGSEVNYQTAICQEGPTIIPNSQLGRTNKSVCMLANTTAIIPPLKQLQKRFKTLFSKRSFVHWFVGEGMEEGTFSESAETLNQIVQSYSDKHGKDDPLQEQSKTQPISAAPKVSARSQQPASDSRQQQNSQQPTKAKNNSLKTENQNKSKQNQEPISAKPIKQQNDKLQNKSNADQGGSKRQANPQSNNNLRAQGADDDLGIKGDDDDDLKIQGADDDLRIQGADDDLRIQGADDDIKVEDANQGQDGNNKPKAQDQ